MRRDRRFTWGDYVMQESLDFYLNIHTASTAGRRMPNPSCTLRCSSPRMHTFIYGDYANA